MLVVLAIMVVIMAIVLTGQNTFNQSLVLANTAYDVGLSIRSAEVYGIASRSLGSALSTGYGVDFSSIPSPSFIFFADISPALPVPNGTCHYVANNADPSGPTGPAAKPGDCIYESGEAVQTYTLGNNMKVSNFCAYTSSGTSYCATGGSASADELDIVFTRPNTSATITALKGGVVTNTLPLSTACITIASPYNTTRVVRVTSVGEIDLPASCP